MNNAHLTHKIFFQEITEKKLNELLKRADKDTKVLQSHINKLLKPYRCVVFITSNKTNNGRLYCDIIIKYYDKSIEIGHATLHLKSDNKNLNISVREKGRLHIRNINNTCYPFSCTKRNIKNKNVSVQLNLITNKYIKPSLKECSDKTILVLNKYFDYNLELSLDKNLTNYPNEIHPCHPAILRNFSRIKAQSIRTTKKQKYKYSLIPN